MINLENRGANYKICFVNFYIDGEELIEIGRIKERQEAFPIIKDYLLKQNKEIRRYIVTEFDDYIKIKNGNNVFRLYKI